VTEPTINADQIADALSRPRPTAQQRAVIAMLAREGHASAAQCAATERFAFYERTRRAFAIVLTGELQPYGNFILKKGVIGEALVP